MQQARGFDKGMWCFVVLSPFCNALATSARLEGGDSVLQALTTPVAVIQGCVRSLRVLCLRMQRSTTLRVFERICVQLVRMCVNSGAL